tara:strand:- start:4538 stop:4993 length:456 start_codon:yes stop_codon:yes gene_type:complete
MMTTFKVGDKVRFGRDNGEQSLGEVVKVNRKSLKVKLLEPRGRYKAHRVGGVWRCPPSLCTLVDGEAEESTAMFPPKKAASGKTTEELMRAIDIVYCALSPENLTCDGELSRTASMHRYRSLKRQLRALFAEIGREVSEGECYRYFEEMRA